MQELNKLLKIYRESLLHGFLKSVENFPERNALWVDDQYYTYEKLYLSSLRMAKVLSHFQDERCVILTSRHVSAYSAVISVLLAGKTYVPLNAHYLSEINLTLFNAVNTNLIIIDNNPLETIKNFILNCKKSLIIFSEKKSFLEEDFRFSHHQFVNISENAGFNFNFKNLSQYAYLMFTSGSTGNPKGIRVSHQNALTYVKNMVNRSQPTEKDKFSQLAELTFDFSVHDLFVAWSVGACVYSITGAHLIHWKNFMDKHQLTFWASVPSSANFIKQTGQLKENIFPSLKYSIFCGEVLSASLTKSWQEAAPRSVIDNLYGPTEAAVACTGYQWKIMQRNDEILPIGKPFPLQRIKIINNEFEEVKKGEIGELCLSGPQVVDSYWQDSKLTHDRFIYFPDDEQCWYRTQDWVKWDDTVGLIYQGRLDDQLKIRGRCVSRLEIEMALKKIAETDSVAILPESNSSDGLVINVIAFVSHSKFSAEYIKKTARNILADYMIPVHIFVLPELPKNANGKLDYTAMRHIMQENALTNYYSQQSLISDPGIYQSYFENLSDDISQLCEILHGILLHFLDAKSFNCDVLPSRLAEMDCRQIKQIIQKVIELDDTLFHSPREISKKILSSCRDFSLLLCSVLRHKKIPARLRFGFTAFLFPGFHHDQTLMEYWDENKKSWCLINARMNSLFIKKYHVKAEDDFYNVSRNSFFVAGDAWLRCRSGTKQADQFGTGNINRVTGWRYIRNKLLQDFAALNKVEMLPWDCWGVMLSGPEDDFIHDSKQMDLLDHIAELTLNPDKNLEQINRIYAAEKDLQVGSEVFCDSLTGAGKWVAVTRSE
ncbi:MAG TPA: AMP-binding protein [Gammaproteobacteria bacterium]|nr:AMP-binding protein [Gammaproteobacteria bacterium]